MRCLAWIAVVVVGCGVAAGQDAAKPVGPVRISGGVMAGQLLTKFNPVYPAEAKAQGISGMVVMRAVIAKDGRIEKLNVVSGDPLLAGAAVDAVQQWTYKPYLLNGQPTEVDTTITVNFSFASPTPRPDMSDAEGVGGTPAGGAKTESLAGARLGPVRVSAGVMQGLKLRTVPPVYPPDAKQAHVTGSVVLRVLIGKDGLVKSLDVVSGPGPLQTSAMNCVRQWTYRPYLLNGQPVEVETTLTVNYMMSN